MYNNEKNLNVYYIDSGKLIKKISLLKLFHISD